MIENIFSGLIILLIVCFSTLSEKSKKIEIPQFRDAIFYSSKDDFFEEEDLEVV